MSQFGLESCWKIVIANLIIFFVLYTEVEVFLDKRVRETRQMARANSRRGATKKREISRTLLSINLHFSVHEATISSSLPVSLSEKLYAFRIRHFQVDI